MSEKRQPEASDSSETSNWGSKIRWDLPTVYEYEIDKFIEESPLKHVGEEGRESARRTLEGMKKHLIFRNDWVTNHSADLEALQIAEYGLFNEEVLKLTGKKLTDLDLKTKIIYRWPNYSGESSITVEHLLLELCGPPEAIVDSAIQGLSDGGCRIPIGVISPDGKKFTFDDPFGHIDKITRKELPDNRKVVISNVKDVKVEKDHDS